MGTGVSTKKMFWLNSGSVLALRPVARKLLSPLRGLTAVFGMGTGVSPSLRPPELSTNLSLSNAEFEKLHVALRNLASAITLDKKPSTY